MTESEAKGVVEAAFTCLDVTSLGDIPQEHTRAFATTIVQGATIYLPYIIHERLEEVG